MRASLLRILSLVQKELLALLRDPRTRFILFAPALLQSVTHLVHAAQERVRVFGQLQRGDAEASGHGLYRLGRIVGNGHELRRDLEFDVVKAVTGAGPHPIEFLAGRRQRGTGNARRP